MTNENGTVWLVYNGEIYNFKTLKKELIKAGHIFRSDSDTEVIIHAYEEWGIESVHRFRGMFAYALWDERLQQLFLVRDRFGIKPLFYYEQDGNLSFASELKALTSDPDINLTLDETAIYDFFTYRYIPTPKTIYQNIKKLPPGHYAIFKNGKLALTQYWDLPFDQDSRISEAEALDCLRNKLKEVVDLHLIADVPVGVMLSGGLDSSTLCALAAKGMHEQLHTFSIGFDVKEHSETEFARMVADQYDTTHHELTLTREMAMASHKRVESLYDEPFADSSAIPTFAVSQLARNNVTVALSGEGGDELFGGYSWYPLYLQVAKGDIIPSQIRRAIGKQVRRLPWDFRGKWKLSIAGLGPIERYVKFISGFLRSEKNAILSPQFLRRFNDYDDYWHFRRYWREDLDPFSRMQYLDFKTFLNDDVLTKMDRASMAVSLEARVPLLDHELVETVIRLPIGVRNRNTEQKYIFKKAVVDDLPSAIIDRKKKGFSAPMHVWLDKNSTESLQPICDSGILSDNCIRHSKFTGNETWPIVIMSRWLHENN